MAGNRLYCGDNLAILRKNIEDESVDLVYLDPPFNSNASYRASLVDGIKAFDDTWRWNPATEDAFRQVVAAGGALSRAMQAFQALLGRNDMMAYLTMMAPRLTEIHRALKPTGSIYLHCDPTASHYLKALMDVVFGGENFRNELIWYYGGRGAKAVARQFPRNHDVILLYSKRNGAHTYRRQYIERMYTPAQAKRQGFRQDAVGRWFKTAPRGDYTDDSVRRLETEGRIYRTTKGGVRVKYPLREEHGRVAEDVLVGDTWLDIPDAMHIGKERLGYPTQKPEALLERIIRAGSSEDDTVLDPFGGCGTAIVTAHKLGRRWIGIDNSRLAVDLMQARLRDTFGESVERSYELVDEVL